MPRTKGEDITVATGGDRSQWPLTGQFTRKLPYRVKHGPPALYSPSCCDDVLMLGAEGASIAQIAAHFNVGRSTIYKWAKDYPEFAEALRVAYEYSQAWWENYGKFAGNIPEFNATVWKKTMEARFRTDYRDSRELEVVGPDGRPVQLAAPAHTALDVDALHPEDRETLKQLLLTAREASEDE